MRKYKVGQTVYVKHTGFGRIIDVRDDGGVIDYYIRIYGGAYYDYFNVEDIE